MTRKTAYIILAVAAAGLLLATACGSAKKTAKNDGYQPAGTPGENRLTPESEFVALAKSYTDWTDVSAPLKLQISEPKRLSVSAQAKMVRGKALSVSLRVFGLEVGSLYADNDSVIVVSKFNSMYCQESLKAISDIFGLTLADIQSLLLGRVFTPGSGSLEPDDISRYTLTLGDNSLSITPKKMPKGISWSFAAALSTEAAPSLRSIIVNAEGHDPIIAAYGSAQASQAGMVAPWANISTTVGTRKVDATATWDLGRAKWNTGVTVSKPRIPSGATRISPAKILEMLKK